MLLLFLNWRFKKDGNIALDWNEQLNNFRHRKLFDLKYGTDTATNVLKPAFNAVPNLEHGKHYMASWTKEVLHSFKIVKDFLGAGFEHYQFIDLGCGKGKVCMVWRLQCMKEAVKQDVLGVDYYPPFIEIARENSRKIFGDTGHFLATGAESINYQAFDKPLIIYLYNPFDGVILAKVLDKLLHLPVLVIYNIPSHRTTLLHYGYQLLYEKYGDNQNEDTQIFVSPSLQIKHVDVVV
jgi:SAM-dependent methyltransferase